jgi:hypothetical protein
VPYAPEASGEVCPNCGAPVAGAYCYRCGQRFEHHLLSMREFLNEAAEVLTHADSRLWHTMVALLLRPGFLTQEFIKGRRARYLPPFRLYIVLSVIFFVSVPLLAQHPGGTRAGGAGDATAQVRVELQAELNDSTDPAERAQLQRLLQPGEPLAASADAATACRGLMNLPAASTWVRQSLFEACEKAKTDNGKELGHNLLHNLGRAMFVFLPLLAALMQLLYRRQHRYYLEHLLLLVHNHAFAFLLMTVYMLITYAMTSDSADGWITSAFSLYGCYYMYMSMRRVYGQRVSTTLVKFATLALAYAIGGLLALLLATLYSALTL